MQLARKAGMSLFCIFLLLFSSPLFARSRQRDIFNIKNISGEEWLLTVRYSDNVIRRTFSLEDHFKVPLRSHEPDGSLNWYKIFPLFITEERRIEMPDGSIMFFFDRNRPVVETLRIYVIDLIVYDMEGNVVLTLDDIQEDHFEFLVSEDQSKPCIIITPEMVRAGR